MRNDRRSSPRVAFNSLARIKGQGGLTRDCRVTDLSDGGARLHIEGIDVPDTFTLVLRGDNGEVRRDCRVKWRLGFEVGAQFTDVKRPNFARRLMGFAALP